MACFSVGATRPLCLGLFIIDLGEEPVEFSLSRQRGQVSIQQHGGDAAELVHTPR